MTDSPDVPGRDEHAPLTRRPQRRLYELEYGADVGRQQVVS
jgi:hypothetical protein